MTVCYYHVTYVFQSESTLYSCLNVKEPLARNRHKIWSLSDCNRTQTHNHLVHKQKSFFSQTLIGLDRPLELQIFVRHMVFIISKGHSYYPENFRSDAYGLNESHFSVRLWMGQTGLSNRTFSSDIWFLSSPRVIVTTLRLRLLG